MNTTCHEHSAECARMKRAEEDIQSIWKAIDQMRAWVIVGMASVIFQVIIFVGSKYIH